MKNYYDQQQELKIAEARKNTLLRKRSIYFNMTQPKAVVIKDIVVMVEPTGDVFLEYMSKVEKIDKKLDAINKEIDILKNDLLSMENGIRKMSSKLAKVFTDVYIDNLSVKETALKENYSESHIYRLLSIIEKQIYSKDDKK